MKDERMIELKIICDCGNETTFNTINTDTGEENKIDPEEGQYATLNPPTFSFWESHDQVGLVCEKCDKSLWLFT